MAEVLQMLLSAQNDILWYEAHLNELRTQYDRKFVAFHNNVVLDADPVLEKLLAKLEKKKIDVSTVFIKFVSRVKAVL